MAQASAEAPAVPDDDDDDLASRAGETEAMDDRAEYEEFQRWLRFRDRRGGWQDRRPQSTRRRDDDDDDDGGSGFRTNAGPPPAWDGSECPFEDYLIRARIWISTTKAQARTRGPLLLKSLSSTPFQDFKHLAKDPAWLANPDNAEMLLKKMDSPEFYGDDQDEHLLASLARVTYHLKRQKNETARQFLGRWEAAERKVQEHKVLLPSLYRGFLMINALGLSDQEIKTLLTFTHGSIEPKDIKVWLRKHETKLQAGQIGNDLGAKAKGATAIHAIDTEDPDRLAEGEENDEIGAMEAMLADLAEDDPATEDAGVFEEDEAAEILVMMIKEKRKTYTQSAQIKKDKELGRGYRSGGVHPAYRDRPGPIRPGTYKLSIAELKQRTKCKRCGKIGHWHRECPQPPPASGSKETHLLEIEIDSYDDAFFCNLLEVEPAGRQDHGSRSEPDYEHRSIEPQGYGKGRPDLASDLFCTELDYVPRRVYDVWFSDHGYHEDDACATIDTGCQRTAVGINTLNRMKPHWPTDLPWYRQTEQNKFRSVHGVSQTNFNAIIPCGLGKRGCYMKPAVFEGEHSQNAPFLISLKFLMQSDAVISLKHDRPMLILTKHGSQMPLHIGPSGALRVPLNQFNQTMLRTLKQSKRALSSGRHGEFEILSLSDRTPREPYQDLAATLIPRACPTAQHGLQLADQQARPRAAAESSAECHLHVLAEGDLEGGDLPKASGSPGGEHVRRLGGCLSGPCPEPPGRDPTGDPQGPAGRRERRPEQAPERGVRAVQAVPGVEEGEKRDREQQGRQLHDDPREGRRRGQPADPRVGVYALQHKDRESRETIGDAFTEQSSTGATSAATGESIDQPEGELIKLEPNDKHQDQRDGHQRNDGATTQPRREGQTAAGEGDERGGDRQEGAAGDLHGHLQRALAGHPHLPVQHGLQGRAERDHTEPQPGVLQLFESRATEPMRHVRVVPGAATSRRGIRRDPGPGLPRIPEEPDGTGESRPSAPGPMSPPLGDRLGEQCLCSSNTLPGLPEGDLDRTQKQQKPGDEEQQRGGELQPRGLPGLSPVEARPLLSTRQQKRLKSAFQQATQGWKAAFDVLNLDLNGSVPTGSAQLGFCDKEAGTSIEYVRQGPQRFP